MDNCDGEKPPKRARLQNYEEDFINQPSTSCDPCGSHTPVGQMGPSVLDMKVEDLILQMIDDPKNTLSCPFSMNLFYKNFLQCILSLFKDEYLAYAENINYVQEKINNCHFEITRNLDIEHYGDDIIEHYGYIVFNELGYIERISDDKRTNILQSILRGIDNKLAKLIHLKNLVIETLVDVEPLPYEDNDYSDVADDNREEQLVYPILHTYQPLVIVEADTMTNIFNDTTVRRLVELSKEEHQKFQNPPDVIAEPTLNLNELNPVLAATDECIEVPQEEEFVSDYTFIFQELQSRVSCMKVLKELCLIGCIEGVLRLGSLESMTITDSFQAHSLSITSITTWKKRIFTTSFDKSLRCFNLETQCVKKLTLPDSLTCADHDGDGILYTGTSKGHIYQLNMLALTIITPFVQVGSEPIDNIIVLRADHPIIRKMIVCTDNTVTLRDCGSGDILVNLRFENVVLCDYSPTTDKIFAASGDSIYRANSLENDNRTIQLLPFPPGGTSILYNHGNLLVSDNDGNTRVFDEDLNHLRLIRGAKNDTITCMSPWKNYVVTWYNLTGTGRYFDKHNMKIVLTFFAML